MVAADGLDASAMTVLGAAHVRRVHHAQLMRLLLRDADLRRHQQAVDVRRQGLLLLLGLRVGRRDLLRLLLYFVKGLLRL